MNTDDKAKGGLETPGEKITITPEMLRDGTVLCGLIIRFINNRTKENMLAVLSCLRDSNVFVDRLKLDKILLLINKYYYGKWYYYYILNNLKNYNNNFLLLSILSFLLSIIIINSSTINRSHRIHHNVWLILSHHCWYWCNLTPIKILWVYHKR